LAKAVYFLNLAAELIRISIKCIECIFATILACDTIYIKLLSHAIAYISINLHAGAGLHLKILEFFLIT
jgi:hypothetical protein